MRRWGQAIAGMLLLSLAGFGVWYGVRTSHAQGLYFASKYGRWKGDPDKILAAAEAAHARYPHNDELCIWTAETAYYRHLDVPVPAAEALRTAAETWCARGLALNPYASPLRLLDVRLTQRRSLAEAISKWEAYVDWQYWEPYNHAVLVELYARAGRYDDALDSLALIKGRAHHAEAKQWLASAWREEISGMHGVSATPRGRL